MAKLSKKLKSKILKHLEKYANSEKETMSEIRSEEAINALLWDEDIEITEKEEQYFLKCTPIEIFQYLLINK